MAILSDKDKRLKFAHMHLHNEENVRNLSRWKNQNII